MLRIHVSENADAAKHYFREGLTTSDYYLEKGLSKGFWFGQAAHKLGLSGEVEQSKFERLIENRHPQTAEKLTPRTKVNRRVGYDLTFNCPKSLSVIYALADLKTRQAIIGAFKTAIFQTMTEIEQDMHTRVRKNNQNGMRRTANLVGALYPHDTSRPQKDTGIPDPHLHGHMYVLNLTHDQIEQRWKAGEFSHIKKNAPYFEAVFHNHLANHIQTIGFGVVPTSKRWEIAGISREMIRAFSNRSNEIDQLAKEKGIKNAEEKANLAAYSRASKSITAAPEVVYADWKRRYEENNGSSIKELFKIKTARKASTKDIVDKTCEHVFERNSTVPTRKVMHTALRFGVGATTQEEIHMELHKRGALFKDYKGEQHITLPDVLKEERQMVNMVRETRGTCRALCQAPIDIQADFLNEGQREAIHLVLNSVDQVTAISGKAGVGKTTVLKEIVRHLNQDNKKVYAFATSTSASRGTLRKEGFAGATTLAAFFNDKKMQGQVKGQIILVDEAVQVGIPSMLQLLKIAKAQKARVILTSDSKQHNSVERGDAFRLLQSKAGMHTAHIGQIVRQKSSYYKYAVDAAYLGNISVAFEWLHTIDAFTEVKEPADRYETLAQDYFTAGQKGQSVLVVSPTHQEAAEITPAIRERLKSAQIIRGKEYERTCFEPLHYSLSEKKLASSYVPGYLLQLNQNVKGFTRGDVLTVVAHQKNNQLLVKHPHQNEVKTFDLKHANHVEVYEPKAIGFAKGDKIRITRNSFTKYGRYRLNGGQEYTVERIKRNGEIILNNGYQLDTDFGHINHAYVSTSFASQSKTVDHILIAQSSMSFGKATNKEQFYVSVSRGRHGVKVYTDDIKGLKQELSKSTERLTATELMNAKRSEWFSDMKHAMNYYKNRMKMEAERLKPSKPKYYSRD